MPLEHSKSEPAFKRNVKTLMGEIGSSPHVKDRSQALAIAYSIKRRGKADGGEVRGLAFGGPPAPWQVRSEARSMMHAGPVMSAVPGRTDRHNVSVAGGSYVLPADHVSSLGQGNTHAGFGVLNAMFHSSGPYGTSGMKMGHGPGAPKPPRPAHFAAGGVKDGTGAPVPVVVAGGEYILTPEQVAQIGGGNVEHGHKILDKWVVENRKKHVSTLKKLPGPAKD